PQEAGVRAREGTSGGGPEVHRGEASDEATQARVLSEGERAPKIGTCRAESEGSGCTRTGASGGGFRAHEADQTCHERFERGKLIRSRLLARGEWQQHVGLPRGDP